MARSTLRRSTKRGSPPLKSTTCRARGYRHRQRTTYLMPMKPFAVSGRASADRSYADRHHGFLLRWPHLRFDQFRGADPTAHRRQASVCRAPGPVSVRAGIHTGECEVLDGRVTGIAVHLGARIAASATANELLVSSTVKDLMAGSGIDFEDRGLQELRGVPGQWRLFAVKTATVLA